MKTHVGLRVRNVERSTDFYAALLGVEPGKLRPGFARFEVEGLVLGLSHDPGVRPGHGAAHHFGFRVDDAAAFEAARGRLAARGLAGRDERDVVCCWARQEKVWYADPDGNEWELYRVTDDAPSVREASPDEARCCVEASG